MGLNEYCLIVLETLSKDTSLILMASYGPVGGFMFEFSRNTFIAPVDFRQLQLVQCFYCYLNLN